MKAPDDSLLTWPFLHLLIANGLLRTASFMHMVLIPLYILSTGASDLVAGLATTVYTLAALLMRPVAGSLTDHRGRYPVVVFGSLVVAIAAATYILPLPVWLLLLARTAQGVGFSLFGTAGMTLGSDLIPRHRLTAGLGILGLEASFAQAVGPAVGIWLSQSAGYPAAFAAAFALTASSLLLRLARRRPLLLADLRRRVVRARSAPRAEPPSSRAPGSRLSRLVEIGSVRPAAVVFLYTFASAAVNTFLAAYALSRGIAQAGLFFTAMGIALGAGRFVIGRLHARFGERWTVVSAIACTVVSMLLITWAANLALLLVAGALFGWGLGLLQPAMTARVISATPAERHGLANSTVFLGVDLGFAVGGLALSAVAGIAGLPWVFLSAALLVGLSLVYYLRISRRAGR